MRSGLARASCSPADPEVAAQSEWTTAIDTNHAALGLTTRLYGDGFQRSAGLTCVKQWRVHGHSERSATAAVKRSSGQTSIPSSVPR
jgi:hypothetical protein